MLASLSLAALLGVQNAPKYTLDVRDAPTSAVFALMLDSELTVMRQFRPMVSLRLTEAQITLPPPSDGRSDYGDYWPIGGWLAHLHKKLGARGLVLGFEREGSAFYASVDGEPSSAGYDFYPASYNDNGLTWHRVWPVGDGKPVPAPQDVPLGGLRLAGVRWAENPDQRRAIMVARSEKGEAFVRVVRPGNGLGFSDLRIVRIDGDVIVLGSGRAGLTRMKLRASQPEPPLLPGMQVGKSFRE